MSERSWPIALVCLLAGFLPAAAGHAQVSTDRRTAAMDSALASTVSADGPGTVLLIAKDGGIVFRGARGLADLESGSALRTDTPIYIASIAKQFTAAMIMRLAERGRLSLDDPIARYVPELAPFAGGVTLRHVLTHTSGLPDHLDIMHDSVPGWTNDDVVSLLQRYGRLDFEPGARSSYSNSGYVMLSLVVETVTGRSFHDALADELFGPLGMSRTTVLDPEHAEPAGRAHGYALAEGRWRDAEYDARTTGSGGVYSTADDLLMWIGALFDGEVVSDSMLRQASSPATRSDGRPTAYGFGWLAEFAVDGPLANVWYVASFGSFKGYQGLVKHIPDRDFTIVALTNCGDLPWNLVELAHALYAH